MTKQIVIDKLREYKDLKKEIRHQRNTALQLNFKTEVVKLDKDISWVNEIIELINEIDSEK